MSALTHSESSDAKKIEPETPQSQKKASAALDLIDEISNATGQTANEVESALLHLLPERLTTRVNPPANPMAQA